MGQGRVFGAVCSAAFLVSMGLKARGDATPLYQWSFNSPPNTPSNGLVVPDVTPNGLATDGGTLTMAIANVASTGATPNVGTYSASGGGVSGAAGDYALNNSASPVHNAAAEGAAITTTANALTAMPNLTQFTIVGWVNPTANAIAGGTGNLNRIFNIGASNAYDGGIAAQNLDGISIQMNNGKVEYIVNSQTAGAASFSTGGGVGTALVANQWQFVALQVNLQSVNTFFDPSIRTATGGAESDNTALYQFNATSNTGGYTYTNGYASVGATGNTSNGTILFGSDINATTGLTNAFATLLNNGLANRAFQGMGDDFQIYNSLLTTQNLQDIITHDDPSASFSTPEPSTVAGIAILTSTTMLRRRRTKRNPTAC